MKLSIIAAAAAALMAVTASTASALPVAKPSQAGVDASSMTEQVQVRKYRNQGYGNKRAWRQNNYNNRRYNKYRGWNRYNSRPNGWRNRGCVAVGPIWFCK